MFSICQRYALKANHNKFQRAPWELPDVFNMSKIRFESKSQQFLRGNGNAEGCFQYVKDTLWKQITTPFFRRWRRSRMFSICQRYALKANHNRRTQAESAPWMFSICQRYALKSNHNTKQNFFCAAWDVFNMSKIRFESKSQPSRCCSVITLWCFQYVKDTLLDFEHKDKAIFSKTKRMCCFLTTLPPPKRVKQRELSCILCEKLSCILYERGLAFFARLTLSLISFGFLERDCFGTDGTARANKLVSSIFLANLVLSLYFSFFVVPLQKTINIFNHGKTSINWERLREGG